jgi:hypothetical protein
MPHAKLCARPRSRHGALALMLIAAVVLAGVVATLLPEVPLVAGGILLLGCLTALFSR